MMAIPNDPSVRALLKISESPSNFWELFFHFKKIHDDLTTQPIVDSFYKFPFIIWKFEIALIKEIKSLESKWVLLA